MEACVHRRFLDWADEDVFTLPRYCFDTDKPHVTITYAAPRSGELGGYTVWRHARATTEVASGLPPTRAKDVAADVAAEIRGPVLTPVHRRDL